VSVGLPAVYVSPAPRREFEPGTPSVTVGDLIISKWIASVKKPAVSI